MKYKRKKPYCVNNIIKLNKNQKEDNKIIQAEDNFFIYWLLEIGKN